MLALAMAMTLATATAMVMVMAMAMVMAMVIAMAMEIAMGNTAFWPPRDTQANANISCIRMSWPTIDNIIKKKEKNKKLTSDRPSNRRKGDPGSTEGRQEEERERDRERNIDRDKEKEREIEMDR